MNSQNVPTLLTAPNKTLKAPTIASRRPSNYNITHGSNNNNSNSNGNNSSNITSPLPRSPSLELSDSFSALSAISTTTIPNTIQQQTNKYSNAGLHHNKSPTEQHYQFFSTSQLASIKPICSTTSINDWSFLSLEKYPASLNS